MFVTIYMAISSASLNNKAMNKNLPRQKWPWTKEKKKYTHYLMFPNGSYPKKLQVVYLNK